MPANTPRNAPTLRHRWELQTRYLRQGLEAISQTELQQTARKFFSPQGVWLGDVSQRWEGR